MWAVSPHDNVTRPQMITHVLSIVLSALTASCMFFSMENENSGTTAIIVNPLQIMIIAAGCSAVVLPPNLFFNWAFEYAAKKQRMQEDINACVGVPGDFKPLGAQAGKSQQAALSFTETKMPKTKVDLVPEGAAIAMLPGSVCCDR